PLKLFGGYTNQVTFSADGSMAFIAARDGRIHVYDTLTRKIFYTIQLSGSSNAISSLVVNDGWLYVSEGSTYGGGGRIMRVDVDQTSAGFLKRQQDIPPLRIINAPLGYLDIAINA